MLDLGPEWLTIVLFGSLVVLLLLGLPLVFAIGGTATIFIILLWGPHALPVLANRTYMAMDMFMLVAVPMFIFMGAMLQRCGIAEDMYELMYHWMGGLRGGLAAGTVLICTMFAAMVGISGAATTSMGLIALPSMLKRGYKKDIAIGCISAGGSLGILIPPSILMIILALTSRQSIGQMFIAGILPGLLLSGLMVAYILIRCAVQKDMGPAVPPADRLPRRERIRLLAGLALPICLIIAVMGSMFFGLATPSEASAVGAFGAILSAVIKRTFNRETFSSALFVTLRLSTMVIWIVFAASAFTALYAVTGASSLIGDLIRGVGEPWMVIITMQLILFVLGMFFDPTGIVLLAAPIFFPIVMSLGFDPLWFAILFVVNMEIAYLTPPFGFNLFYMKAVVPPGVTMFDIYKSAIPFVLLMIFGLALCMIFPGIITWLPSLMQT
ncbi:tripartite ATP-independent transporter DctM subunit [Constrictibacter sp. MBR-5]|jgi:tripartite ATP-independent transporter DctM subunit|uniref:TRAP transporter large permease n=1 Tax=Constrictibacter sp. MBR-5 TaxID=3156467 RepID=UPI003394A4A5